MKMLLSLLPALLVSLAACGGVHHASRPDQTPAAKDPSLVEVRTTGFDGPTRIVSYSIWDVDPSDELPVTAPAQVVSDMREQAAQFGAEMLLLERVEDAWRKAWLGLGVVKDEAGKRVVEPCVHKGFEAAAADAKVRATRCAAGILYERAAIRGSVDVLFEVDPEGNVLRAAPTPDSSRDSELQQCVVGAVHTTAFGRPLGFTCQGHVAVAITGPDSVN